MTQFKEDGRKLNAKTNTSKHWEKKNTVQNDVKSKHIDIKSEQNKQVNF